MDDVNAAVKELSKIYEQKSQIEEKEIKIKTLIYNALLPKSNGKIESKTLKLFMGDRVREEFAKNCNEVLPVEKISAILAERLRKGEISIEQILPLLDENAQKTIRQGLHSLGAIKTAKRKVLVVEPK